MKKENTINDIYLYETKEYNEFVNKSKISLEEAISIICKSKEYTPFLQHYLIYNNEFIFTALPPSHAGTLKLVEGLRVHINTGEVFKINKDTYKNQRIQVGTSISVKCK
ncbi:hypothetical protein [Arcobacter sp.]|uniref:hypothetical protein n=1 Tax=Arcobacter sp. TaxID=1872629 RepID=UPI003C74C3F4